MISRELEAEILRLYHTEKWPVGTLARQLKVHRSTVRRVLGQAGLSVVHHYTRPSMAEPFIPFIQETLTLYPTLRASRLYRMVRERGYPGASRSLPRDRRAAAATSPRGGVSALAYPCGGTGSG